MAIKVNDDLILSDSEREDLRIVTLSPDQALALIDSEGSTDELDEALDYERGDVVTEKKRRGLVLIVIS